MDRIDALRLFVRLVERGTFSAAARDVQIKQSTASKWIARLEEEHGVALVERTTRALRITDAGQLLYARAGELVAAYESLASEVRESQVAPVLRGRVRVSVPVVFGERFLTPLVAEFLRDHPEVQVELMFNDRYVNLVEEGFDLAVRVGVPVDTSSRGRKLAEGKRKLVASPAYLAERGTPKSAGELSAHSCLTASDISLGDRWLLRAPDGARESVAARGRVSATHAGALVQLAREGFGIAALADWMVRDDLAQGLLAEVLGDHALPAAPIFALLPPGRFTKASTRALLEHLKGRLAHALESA